MDDKKVSGLVSDLKNVLMGVDEVLNAGDRVGVRLGAACAVLTVELHSGSNTPRIVLKNLVTEPEKRRSGEATRLLQKIISAADELMLPMVLVAIPKDMPAGTASRDAATRLREFYGKFGFDQGVMQLRMPGADVNLSQRP